MWAGAARGSVLCCFVLLCFRPHQACRPEASGGALQGRQAGSSPLTRPPKGAAPTRPHTHPCHQPGPDGPSQQGLDEHALPSPSEGL